MVTRTLHMVKVLNMVNDIKYGQGVVKCGKGNQNVCKGYSNKL